ncbi:MAG: hypothetical protein KHY36_11895, partial [Subdoligranulum variabile]|nr:hypothetical protein [Subdoligranulum variabile]
TLCIIEHFGNADAVPQPPERCLSRKAGIMRCCHKDKWLPAGTLRADTSIRPYHSTILLQNTLLFTLYMVKFFP